MAEIVTQSPFPSEAPDGITAAALRAEAWAGEPFLEPDDDPAVALAPGTALRRALDDALAEMEAGRREPSPEWKVQYALMLGLERVLSEKPPRLASGTELRRHQVDALAGMLTELIADHQKASETGNGTGLAGAAEVVEDAEDVDELSRSAYQLVICDEAHTALGEKTSAAIRRFYEPIYVGMTATEELIAKQVSDVFPASVDDLPLADAARRGLIAPLRCLRVPPVAAINQVPIVGGDFEERALAAALDHQALNQAAATLYRERFGDAPGIVYAAGVDHAYNLATAFRAAGVKAEAVSGRTPPVKLAEILAAYERGEIDVPGNAMLLAEGWNSPRATVIMHLAPTASKRVYQQRIGRIMHIHPRKEAGIVVDFTPKAATHNERVVSLHSLLDADFYREGARVTPAPRRRMQRRARRKLTPASWLVPGTPDVVRRLAVITREWQRIG